jgi:hypothetical protein
MTLPIQKNPNSATQGMLNLGLEPIKNGSENILQVTIPLKNGTGVKFKFTAGMSIKEFKPQDIDLLLGVINKAALNLLAKKGISLNQAEFLTV